MLKPLTLLVVGFSSLAPETLLDAAAGAAVPTALRCEDLDGPMEVTEPQPRLTWQVVDPRQERGRRQIAYRVLVASTPELLVKEIGDLWDSGKVAESQTRGAIYGGKQIPRQSCYWKVGLWTVAPGAAETAPTFAWSQPASWIMGVQDDWRGGWIAARDVPMNPPRGQHYIPAPVSQGRFIDASKIGYHAVIATQAETLKWVQIDLGRSVPLDEIRLRSLKHAGVAGFGFPLRYRLEVSDEATFAQPRVLEDHTQADVPNPGETWLTVSGRGTSGRYVRMTATKLFARPGKPGKPSEFCFGLRAMEVLSGGQNVAANAPVEALDSVESFGWEKSLLSKPILAPRREALLVRREVDSPRKPARVIARVTALGFVELQVNGEKIGDRAMAAPVTDATKRIYYDTYDVTAQWRQGANAVGVVLGNGYFSPPGRGWAAWFGVGNEPVLSVELELIMPDGQRQFIVSDPSWSWSSSEITFNDFFAGETQDLRLAKPGWSRPGFTGGTWEPMVAVTPPPGRVEANPCPPVRACQVIKPVRVEGKRYIFDSMYAGWPRIKVSGKPGQVVRISGNYQFTLAGNGPEILEPKFADHTIGPVLTIDGIEPPEADAVSIVWGRSDLRLTGEFSCSNAFLNRVHAAMMRTHLNYTFDIPMDPTREKAGWTQDVQTMIDSTCYLTDMAALYRRWWIDFRDSQTPDGASGSVAPMVWGGQEHCWDDPWWSGMIIFTPWKHYQYYGDKRMLAMAYEPMKAYFGWLSNKADPKDGLMQWAGASDWIEVGIDGWGPPKRTPRYVVSTCAWYLYADIISQTARLLGKADEAEVYAAKAKAIKANFNAQCFNPETGLYAKAADSQTSLILPLGLGMVPEAKRELVTQRLVENIHQWKDHLSTGFVGTPYLLEGLPELGQAELSYKIVNQQDYAGWNTLITDGVMKETWRGGMAQMPSLGGSIGQWFYKTAAGIRPDPSDPGFRSISIRPSLMGDLQWVKCRFDSPYGPIISNWTRVDGPLTMDVTIPFNTTATVEVPTRQGAAITESARPAGEAPGVTFLRMAPGAAIYRVVAGTYHFQSTP